MKVIADRATNWRLELECSDCQSDLELECADLTAERPSATDSHEDMPYDPIYAEPPSAGFPTPPTPLVFFCVCGACKARLVVDPDDLPVFVLDRLVGAFIVESRKAPA